MSEKAIRFFQAIGEELSNGVGRFVTEVGAEVGRLNTQATMELASALFNGDAFVPYGPGQYTPALESPDLSHESPEIERELER